MIVTIVNPCFTCILSCIDIPHGSENARKWLNLHDFKQQLCKTKNNHFTNCSIKALSYVKSMMT
jgi:hypothetical protein